MFYCIIIAVYILLWLHDMIDMCYHVSDRICVKLIIGYDRMRATEYTDLHLAYRDSILAELFL